MIKDWLQPPQLRIGEDSVAERRATWLELFFDLVFVVAIAQLAHKLNEDISLSGFFGFVALSGDTAIVAGESGGAGLAGVIAVLKDAELAARIGLGPDARVWVINTEGAIDPTVYAGIIGRTPEAVLAEVAA